MKYYNQNDYANAPYPSYENKSATIKSGGCGVCSAANVLAFFGVAGYDPIALSQIFMREGARVSGGTDMKKAAAIVCRLGNLTCTITNSEKDLAAHLGGGGVAIANVDGDIGAKGIFSSAGHYINIIGNDNTPPKPIIVFDVGYYSGKFNDAYRKKYVSVNTDKYGNTIQFTTKDALQIDTAGRTPNYYLFSAKEVPAEPTPPIDIPWYQAEMDWAKANGVMDGTRPNELATRAEVVAMIHRATGK